jgi:hypothetical protein
MKRYINLAIVIFLTISSLYSDGKATEKLGYFIKKNI